MSLTVNFPAPRRVVMAIFAKKGTTEKVLFPVFEDKIGEAMRALNILYGDDWVYCEALKKGEAIKFTDGLVYRGFHPDIKRYSDAVIKVD